MAPCVFKPSAAMVLAMWDKQALVFNKDIYKIPVPSLCGEIIEARIHFHVFLSKFYTTRVKALTLHSAVVAV